MIARRSMDDPRLLLSFSFRAVHFVFGLTSPAGVPLPVTQALPGTALIASLEAIGMSRTAARGALLRLRRAGALTSRRRGRRADYELTPASQRLVAEVFRRVTEEPPAWDGVFRAALVAVPPAARSYRETFKRRASYAGFGALRPGLLIAPYERSWSAIEPVIALAREDTWITRADLRLSDSDARRAARVVWELDALAAALRSESKRMSTAVAIHGAKPRSGPRAMAVLWKAIAPFFQLFSVQPPLPAELLPHDWPMAEARRSFLKVGEIVAPPALAYLSSLTDSARTSGR